MSARKSKVKKINLSSKIFPTFEAALKEANAIKIWLTRFCERNGYSCKAIIGVSQNNPRTGVVTTVKGKRGRPKKSFKRTKNIMMPMQVRPHIHIVLYANPADTIEKELAIHLNKKYKAEIVEPRDCTDHITNAVNYLVKQSIKTRTVNCDKQGVLSSDEFGFCRTVRAAEEEFWGGISFTFLKKQENTKTLENKGFSDASDNAKELRCKRNNNNTLRDSVDIPSSKSFNIKNIIDIIKDMTREPLEHNSS